MEMNWEVDCKGPCDCIKWTTHAKLESSHIAQTSANGDQKKLTEKVAVPLI